MPIGVPKVGFLLNGEEDAHWVDLYNRLYRDRILFMGSNLDDELANQLIGIMQYLYRENPRIEQNLYINSMGGGLLAGLAIFDNMRTISPKIIATCVGHASSMASCILCASDVRLALRHSQMMIHQPSTGLEGQALDINLESNQVAILRTKVCIFYSRMTGKNKCIITEDMDRDAFMSAKKSKEYGLIDQIIKEQGIYDDYIHPLPTGTFYADYPTNPAPAPVSAPQLEFSR